MPNDVGIYNLALLHLGIDQIDGFADGSVASDAGNTQYAITRDSLLESADWAFAYTVGVALNVDAAEPTPASGLWTHKFTLPSDLRALKRVHDNSWDIPFLHVEINQIYTQQDTNVWVDYIRDVDESVFPNLFVQALSYQLASDVCMTLTADQGLLQLMQQSATFYTATARNRDAYQQRPQKAGRMDLSR